MELKAKCGVNNLSQGVGVFHQENLSFHKHFLNSAGTMNEAQRHRVGLRNLKICAALWTPGALNTDSSAAAFSNKTLLKITALVSADQR